MNFDQFEMIDSIQEISLDDGFIKTCSIIPHYDRIFEAHFPDFPVVPGVLLSEVMGQTSCLIVMASVNYSHLGILAAQNKTRYRQFISPGDILSTQVRLKHLGDGFAVCQAEISKNADGKVVADSELTIKLIPFPTEGVRSSFIERSGRLMHHLHQRVDSQCMD